MGRRVVCGWRLTELLRGLAVNWTSSNYTEMHRGHEREVDWGRSCWKRRAKALRRSFSGQSSFPCRAGDRQTTGTPEGETVGHCELPWRLLLAGACAHTSLQVVSRRARRGQWAAVCLLFGERYARGVGGVFLVALAGPRDTRDKARRGSEKQPQTRGCGMRGECG